MLIVCRFAALPRLNIELSANNLDRKKINESIKRAKFAIR